MVFILTQKKHCTEADKHTEQTVEIKAECFQCDECTREEPQGHHTLKASEHLEGTNCRPLTFHVLVHIKTQQKSHV